MHPRSCSTQPWTIMRREQRGATVAYTTVEDRLEGRPSLADAKVYYQSMYAHDDANGTEVIFTRPGEFHVVRVERPQPPVNLARVEVR